MLLADMGARVIKIEQPGKGDDTRAWGPPFLEGESAYFLSINRNKESVTLDFKQPGGRAILDRLIAQADVLVENFRPGTLDQARARLRRRSRTAIRASSTARSPVSATAGRDAKQPGYDAVMQAEGGLMSITGAADGPPFRLGVAIADIVSGHVRRVRHRDGAASRASAPDAARRWTSRCSTRWRRCSPIRPATISRAARRRRVSATATPASCRTRRSPRRTAISCSPSATTTSGERSAAWRGSIDDGRFATNRQRVTGYDALRPIVADRAADTHARSTGSTRLTAAGVPVRVRPHLRRSCSPIRRSTRVR